MDNPTTQFNQVLDFWFVESEPKQWFNGGEAFDAVIKSRFTSLLTQAIAGELHHWRLFGQGRLAEVIILDQFSRNIYRGNAHAFAQDPQALTLAQEAVAMGTLEQLTPVEQAFLLMPYMHSESRHIHELAVPLFKQYGEPSNYEFELKHKSIIDKFGRYPHRNAILGRQSSAEELAFLQHPGSSF